MDVIPSTAAKRAGYFNLRIIRHITIHHFHIILARQPRTHGIIHSHDHDTRVIRTQTYAYSHRRPTYHAYAIAWYRVCGGWLMVYAYMQAWVYMTSRLWHMLNDGNLSFSWFKAIGMINGLPLPWYYTIITCSYILRDIFCMPGIDHFEFYMEFLWRCIWPMCKWMIKPATR